MKKNIIILSAMLFSSFALSQVGVNTPDPKATLDITAKISKGKTSNPEGLLVPRVDRERAQSMIGTAISTLVYVDDPTTGLQNGTAINIDEAGYYYFDGRFWVKLNTLSSINPLVNIYNSDGTISANRTVTQADKRLAFTGSVTNAFSVDGNTFSVDAENHRIGIGNAAPEQRLSVVDRVNTNQYQGIASFLANNLTQGVGIGWNGIQSIGTADNVNLNLNGKGTGNVLLQTNSTGNVGIGTTAPIYKLDFGSSAPASASDPLAKKLALYSGTDGNSFYGLGVSSFRLLFHANDTQTSNPAMVIDGSTKNVGIGTNNPDGRAILDLSATNKGFLPPRMTTAQRNALSNRPAGLMIYNVSTNCMDFWNSSEWVSMCATIAPLPGIITSITCTSATNSGTIVTGTSALSTSSIPYTGGNAGSHGGQIVASTGVTGLTATLAPGSFANGAGSVIYTITGTPSAVGTANFAINIGGRTCTLARIVSLPQGIITGLNCDNATNNGTLTGGTAASGVSSVISYTGGNTGTHNGQTVASTGVTGLTATLTAGAFANGNGTLTYTITGTPAASGTASFAINIGGRTCTLTRMVAGATTPPEPDLSAQCTGWAIPYQANGGITSTTINGQQLTATFGGNSSGNPHAVSGSTLCGVTTTNGAAFSFSWTQGYVSIKFNRFVSNLKVSHITSSTTGNEDNTRYVFKRNGIIVSDVQQTTLGMCGTNYSYTWTATGYTIRRNAVDGYNYAGTRYNFGRVWFDEVEIYPGKNGGQVGNSATTLSLCVGSVQ